MLLEQRNSWGYQWDCLRTADTPSTSSVGLAVTAHASVDTKGSWVNICTTNRDGAGSVTKITRDVYRVDIVVMGTATAATARACLLDIGVDLAGGTSYTTVISNLLCGQLAGSDGLMRFSFPLFINGATGSNATVGARIASTVGASTAIVGAYYYGSPSRPEVVYSRPVAQSVGIANDGSVPAGCVGTAVTPGNSGAWGSWTSLGTTIRPSSEWTLAAQMSNTTVATLAYFFELGWGDATTPIRVIGKNWCLTTTGENTYWYYNTPSANYSIPEGATLYVRATCSGTSDTGWTAAAYGV